MEACFVDYGQGDESSALDPTSPPTTSATKGGASPKGPISRLEDMPLELANSQVGKGPHMPSKRLEMILI